MLSPTGSSRPSSCPPPQVETEFTTPSRPASKRRRSAASSSSNRTPTLDITADMYSPSTPVLMMSPTSSPSTSPNFQFDTPTEQEYLKMKNQCEFCLAFFKSARSLKNEHKCIFRPDYQFFKVNGIHPVILTRPKNWEETLKILNQLSKEDIVKICILQNWCLPSYYPFVFPHQIRSGRTGNVPILDTMTASKFSATLLKKMLGLERKLLLPKHIILRDEASGMIAHLSPKVLSPTLEFSFSETSESFNVTVKAEPSAQVEPFEEDDMDIFSDESDSEDVIYSFHGPAPAPIMTDDEELPSPPYTSRTFPDFTSSGNERGSGRQPGAVSTPSTSFCTIGGVEGDTGRVPSRDTVVQSAGGGDPGGAGCDQGGGHRGVGGRAEGGGGGSCGDEGGSSEGGSGGGGGGSGGGDDDMDTSIDEHVAD